MIPSLVRRLLIVALAAAGCTVEIEFGDTEFLCATDGVCPSGFQCVDELCVRESTLRCGDGQVSAGEQCDAPFGPCCDPSSCLVRPASFSCRSRVSECDLAEFCSGDGAECPADELSAEGTACIDGDCAGGFCQSSSLLVHLAFEGTAGLAVDVSGNGRDAMIDGPTRVPGRFGGALEFAGTGDHVFDENADDYLNGLTALTVTMWIRADSIPSDRGLLTGEQPTDDGVGNDGRGVSLRYDLVGALGDGQGVLKAGVLADLRQELESTSGRQVTEWQFLALTWVADDGLALYIDGAKDPTSFLGTPSPGSVTGVSKLLIGRAAKDGLDSSWDGLIDDVRIYNRALSESEIGSLSAP